MTHRRAASTQAFDHEPALEAACRASRPHGLLSEIPAELVPWLLPIGWDRERLWALDRQPHALPLRMVRWVYDLPIWRGEDGHWFEVRPADVLAAPHQHPAHRRRVIDADTDYPIHVIWRRDRWMVLDGVHRTVRADLTGEHHIQAIFVTPDDVSSFALATSTGG